MTTECSSIRGEWGGICPDCGQRLPEKPKGAPSSKTLKVIPWSTSGRVWSKKRADNYLAGGGQKYRSREVSTK